MKMSSARTVLILVAACCIFGYGGYRYAGEKLQKKPPKLYSAPIFEQKTFSEIEEKYILFSQS